jgi:hypothetical protein
MQITNIVYKTTNLINNKIYIGVHSYKKYMGYIGSGTYITNAIKKYGKENFRFEILYYTDTAAQADVIEEMLVTKDFIERIDTYNEVPGGYRNTGWKQTHNKRCISKANKTRTKLFGNPMGQCHSKEAIDKQFLTKTIKYGNKMGPCHSLESQIKGRLKRIEKYGSMMGKANSIESTIKGRETRVKNAFIKTPELGNPCKLISAVNNIELEGNIYDICFHLFGQREAIKYRYTVIDRLKDGKPFKLGKWKGYKVLP